MKEFMTYQMALLEERLQGEQRGRAKERESVAIKMLRKGKSFDEVHEFTDLPFERLEQLANDNRNN